MLTKPNKITPEKNGLLFWGSHSFGSFPTINFGKESKWKISIHFLEHQNDAKFNFFFGERGSRYHGFARVNNKIMYRLGDGSYIGGLLYSVGKPIQLEVRYDRGRWEFSDGVNKVRAEAKTDVLFNAIGSGFTGKEFEEKTQISFVGVAHYSDAKKQYEEVGKWLFDENKGCVAFDSSGRARHAVLQNTHWINGYLPQKEQKISAPLTQLDWKTYTYCPPQKNFLFAFDAYKRSKDVFLWKIIQEGVSEKNRRNGEQLFNNIYQFDRFEAVELPVSLTWSEDPFRNRSWEWQFHQWVFFTGFIGAHANTGEKKYLDRLLELIGSWCTRNYTKHYPSKLSWHDHTTALRLRCLIYIWEYLRNTDYQVEEVSINLLLNLVESHCNVLSSSTFYTPHNNHGFDQSLFLYWASVKFPEFENAKTWHTIGLNRLVDEISVAFTSEGMHVENSPSYLVSMLQRVELASNMMHNYETNNPINFDLILNSALRCLAHLIHPDGTLPMLGDTDLGTRIPAMKQLKKQSNFSLFQYIFSKGKSGACKDHGVDAVFVESGYAVFRDRWHKKETFEQMVHMVFKCGFLSSFHRHDDDLSFILAGMGEYWFVDGGIYSYNEKDPFRHYFRSAGAHNIPLVPEVTPTRRLNHEPARQSGIIDYRLDPEISWVKAKTFMFPGFCITRTVEYIRPNRFIISDKVIGDFGSTPSYDLMFHIPSDKGVVIENDNQVMITGERSHQLCMLFDGDCSFSFDLNSGVKEGQIRGWQSKRFSQMEKIQTLRCKVIPQNEDARSIVELTLSERRSHGGEGN